jgi:protein pelota
MRIIKKDLKRGIITLKMEVEDDIWYLKNIVELGDRIKSRTLRSEFIERDGRKIKTGKRPMLLVIELEKIEFNNYVYKLRLMGKIIDGPDDVQIGSYHTIEIGVGDILSIKKTRWKKYQLEKIKKSKKKSPKVSFAVVDNNEATFGLLGGTGLKIVSELKNRHSVQHEEEKIIEFYKSVATEIEKISHNTEKTILAGPGFAKEHVKKIIDRNYPHLNEKLMIDSTSSATSSGINELLKRGNLDRIIQESEIIKETRLIEDFFSHLKKEDNLAVYGFEELSNADKIGGIETVLVSDQKIKETKVEKLLNSIENKGGKVEIISTNHVSGEQFHRMGGLGAILRFKLY